MGSPSQAKRPHPQASSGSERLPAADGFWSRALVALIPRPRHRRLLSGDRMGILGRHDHSPRPLRPH